MKNKLLILLAFLLLVGCSTRKKNVLITDYKSSEVTRVQADSTEDKKVTEQKKVIDNARVEKKETESVANVKIEGKTDSLNSFDYNALFGGDSLRIQIRGNAQFSILTSNSNKASKEEKKAEKEDLNIIQEVARKAVAKETIKDVAEKVKEVSKDVTAKSFTFGAWFTSLLIFIAIMCAIWLFYYLGGKLNIKELLQKLWKK